MKTYQVFYAWDKLAYLAYFLIGCLNYERLNSIIMYVRPDPMSFDSFTNTHERWFLMSFKICFLKGCCSGVHVTHIYNKAYDWDAMTIYLCILCMEMGIVIVYVTHVTWLEYQIFTLT